MAESGTIYIGQSVKPEVLLLRLANRHGLITGATGTGKTISLQVLAEAFSQNGVPVFCADVKGDLAGLAETGVAKPFLAERAEKIGLEDYRFFACPAIFWDLFGEQGHPIRATISEMGPLLLSRLMDLNETQEGVLNIGFRIADEEGLLLLDLKDLRALLVNIAERAAELTTEYGNVSKSTIGSIQRRLLVLEQQGGDHFFGEPALDIKDLMLKEDGKGVVSILAADKLMASPRLYATFLLWLLSELFEQMPEVGDPEKPNLVFFFDEAHLLFDEAPKALVDKVEQVVRLIRSKGIGVYFVTQNPLDVPDSVSSQLGNRIQHALRAFSPREQKAVRAAAETFRANPKFNTEKAIMELGVGEALISTLDPKGQPSMVERTLVRPPSTRVGPVTGDERRSIMQASPVSGKYDKVQDRDSAYEMLTRRAGGKVDADTAPPGDSGYDRQPAPAPSDAEPDYERHGEFRVPRIPRPGAPAGDEPRTEAPRPAPTRMPRTPPPAQQAPKQPKAGYQRQSVTEALAKSVARSVGTALGSAIIRGVLGGLTGKKRR